MSDDQHKKLKRRDVSSNPRPSQAPGSFSSTAQVGPLELGSVVGGSYRILEFIGQGGMGFVYKVEHLMMAKTLALKVLRPEQVSESTWKRFRIEAQAIARLNHPNVIRTYDMNQTESGLPFYTMDLLIGLSLADYLDSCEELSLKEALPVFRQVCSGLAHAHDRGIIHRDIKPANIMLVSDNSSIGLPVVKIVDFGIAKFSTIDGQIDQGLTQQGEVCGSPVYMSPEQCAGMPLNHRTDMYSLGVTMFQALTGKLPLLGKTAIQTAVLHQSVVPPLLSEVTDGKRFPAELEQIVARLLEKSPDDRYDSLATVSHELLAIERQREGARSAIAVVKLPSKIPVLSDLESRQELQDKSFDDRREEQQKNYQAEYEQAEADDRESYWSDRLQNRFFGRKRIITSSRFVILCSLIVTSLLVTTVVAVVVRSLYKFRAPFESRNRLVAPSKGSADSLHSIAFNVLTKDEPIVSTDQSKQIRLFLNSRKEPYSSAQVNGSHRGVIFSFPSDFSLGELTFSQLGKSTSVAAQGEVIVPSNVGPNLKFEVGESVKRYPELLRYFRDNEIGSIFISDLESRSPLLLPALLRLKGLRGLKMQRLCLDNADIDSLDGFQALQYLAIHQCTVDGANLAHCKILSKLHILNIESMQNITPVLKVLEKSKVLYELKLGYSKLSTDNLQSLSKMTELRTLSLRGTSISDLDLRKLSSLPHLKVLDLDCCNNLTPAAIEILKEFKCLEDLTLPDALSTESNEAILKREIPRLQRF